ncbi:unnamed protein product [Allacma fusca]|uniref:Uncharacterized protein n=1 Tax=Allacma fusca TaxID=39272 RepID=A0A8J2JGL6_9HEXA|nr:unnamed protein product [Allacma fusca]
MLVIPCRDLPEKNFIGTSVGSVNNKEKLPGKKYGRRLNDEGTISWLPRPLDSGGRTAADPRTASVSTEMESHRSYSQLGKIQQI